MVSAPIAVQDSYFSASSFNLEVSPRSTTLGDTTTGVSSTLQRLISIHVPLVPLFRCQISTQKRSVGGFRSADKDKVVTFQDATIFAMIQI